MFLNMSFKDRKFSLDSSISLNNEGEGRHGPKANRKAYGNRSVQVSQLDIHVLGHALERSSFVRPQKIEEEAAEQPDRLDSKNSFEKGNRTFHKLFPAIPLGETLTHTFSCALQKEGLYQGKLYVSKNFVCFHSSVLLKDTSVMMKMSEVMEVKKQSSALSMLSLHTLAGEKFSFVALRKREGCHKLLQSLCPHTQGQSPHSSPHMSSAETADTISSASSRDGSLKRRLERVSSLPGNDSTGPSERGQKCSSGRRRSTSRDKEDHRTHNEVRAESMTWSIAERVKSSLLFREISSYNPNIYLFLLLVVLLLLSTGYIGLRIVALEKQLNSLGALPDVSLPHTEVKKS